MPNPKLMCLDLTHGPITKEDLLAQLKAELDKEFPTGVALKNSRITITVDNKSPSVPKSRKK